MSKLIKRANRNGRSNSNYRKAFFLKGYHVNTYYNYVYSKKKSYPKIILQIFKTKRRTRIYMDIQK